MTGSHRLTMTNGKVTIHDLELFVGFDPAIDAPDNEKLKKYDRPKVEAIIARTHEFGERGQSPKLILEHNPTETDAPGSPIVGDIPHKSLHFVEIKGAPGIAGDVVLSREDFETYIRSNRYPRRSAEIWPDGYFSEVALLSGRTPARPLPDTRFKRNGVDFFVRDLPVMEFTPRRFGRELASTLNGLIDAKAKADSSPRSDVVEELASAGDVDAGTMNQILGAEIAFPPLARLDGFAEALGVSVKRLRNAAEKDGADYDDESASGGTRDAVHGDTKPEVNQADPGPTNVNPPSTARKRTMANEHDEEVGKLKARNQELEDEVTKLKAKMQQSDDDDNEKEMQRRDASLAAERWEGDKEVFAVRIADLEDDNLRERYGRRFDELDHLGYRVGGVAARAEHMRRIIKASKDGTSPKERATCAETEYIYIKGNFHRDPVNVPPIDQQHVRAGTGSQREQMEKEKEAAKVANLRCVSEGKHDPTTFSRYYEEALAAA